MTPSIFSIGDNAITIDFGNIIDQKINDRVVSLFQHLNTDPIPGMIEAVPAYASLTIYYDIISIRKLNKNISPIHYMVEKAEDLIEKEIDTKSSQQQLVRIPVCYEKEYGLDLEEMSTTSNQKVEDIISIHTSKTYRVYMLGFLPGFAYMGEVDERIATPRKKNPRQKVDAGSVGIAGKQTGVYPLESPGGWQIIGRTPLKLFDPEKEEPTLIKAGNIIQFYSITKHEFEDHQIRNA